MDADRVLEADDMDYVVLVRALVEQALELHQDKVKWQAVQIANRVGEVFSGDN